jgi:hypothetical protein
MSDEQTRLLNEILAAVKEQTAVLKQYREELVLARHARPAGQPASGATRAGLRPAKRRIAMAVGVGFLILVCMSLATARMLSAPSKYNEPLIDPVTGHLRQQ